MSSEIIVALIAFAGTAVGTFGGIVKSSQLTNHRLLQLEKKVDEHNSVIKRTYQLETDMTNVKEDIVEIKEDIKQCTL